MKPQPLPLDEIQFLRLLNGRYDEQVSNKIFLAVLAIKFTLLAPLLFAWALSKDHTPIEEWNADLWILALFIPASMLLGIWIFYYIGGEYEFSARSVTLRRRGIVIEQMQYEDVIGAEYAEDHHGHRTLTLKSDRKRIIIFLFPKLNAAVEKAKTQVDIWKSEAAANP